MQASGSGAEPRYLWQIDVNHGLSSRLSSDGAQMSAALDGGHAEVKDDYIPSPSLPDPPHPSSFSSVPPLAAPPRPPLSSHNISLAHDDKAEDGLEHPSP